MSFYRVMLHGENFLVIFDGKLKRVGFYTTRDVEADSFADAARKAVELVKNEYRLKDSYAEKNESPTVSVKEMRLVMPNEKHLENRGYTFYKEDETS